MNEFAKLIIQTSQSSKPAFRYSKMNAYQLLYCLAMLRAMGRDCVARILLKDRPNPSLEDLKKVAGQAADISDEPSPKRLERLYASCHDMKPLKFLVECRFEQEAIYKETKNRLKKSGVGMEALRLLGRKSKPLTLDDLHKALKVERMQTYKPDKEMDEDLRSVAVGGVWNRFQKLGQTLKVKLPTGPYPAVPQNVGIPVDEKDTWSQLNAVMLQRDFEQMQENILPALQGKRLSGGARQALRDHWEKRDAQKREGEEFDLSEGQRLLRREGRLDRHEEEEMEQKADVSARMYKVLKEAQRQKRWGKKAITAFKYYLEGKTEEEACKLAKITPRTFQNYIARFREKFAPKK